MKLSLILLSLFLTSGFNSISQKVKYLKGYYINSQEDTIHGFLAATFKDGPVFKYKLTADAEEVRKISSDTCKQILAGKNNYMSWYGPRGMSYIDKFEFTLRVI